MAKRTAHEGIGKRLEREKPLEEEAQDRVEVAEVPVPQEYTPEIVQIVSLRDGIVNVTGKTTGKKYKFIGAGSVVDVDGRDAQEILSRRSGRSCCGPGFTPFFATK